MEKRLILSDRTVQCADGSIISGKYEADLEDVIVYEFYVPNAMLNNEETARFLQGVISLPGGGTVFPDVMGVWQGQVEQVTIYRIIVRAHQTGLGDADLWIADEIARLMHQLRRTSAEQHEVLFTKSKSQAYSVKTT